MPRSGCWSSVRAKAADFEFRFSTPASVQCTGWSEKLLHGANGLVPGQAEAAGALREQRKPILSDKSSTAQVLAQRNDKYETETMRSSTSAPPLQRRGEGAGALGAEAADFERRELDSSGTCSTKRQVRDGDDKVAVNSAARLPRSGCWSSERAEAADFVFRFSTPALV